MTIDPNLKTLDSFAEILSGGQKPQMVHRFTIPQPLRGVAKGVVAIGIRELSSDDELAAANRCKNSPIRLAYEQAKEAFCEVTLGVEGAPDSKGKRVRLSTGDGTADNVWAQLHPMIRTLVITAYGKVHSPDDAVTKGFLESQEMSTG